MDKVSECSFCDNIALQAHDSGSFSQCPKCGFIGWWLLDPVRPGQGRGYKCVNCGRQTLHNLVPVPGTNNVVMFRCSTCLYAGVGPTPE
jgi:predicted RNA-binding Zn-ribbon protein involved in translation (DUF1610 family)